MSRSAWRRILGWVLTVLGMLAFLFGLVAILTASDPSVVDQGGAAFVVIGLIGAAVGIYIVRTTRAGSRAMLSPEHQQNADRRRSRNSVVACAVASLIGLLIALHYYQSSQSLAADVDALEAAVPCTTHPGDPNCYELRDVSITSVDVMYNRSSETDTVKFLDGGNPHEVSIPLGRVSSVLRAGEPAVATLWRGRYTQLQVAGTTFVTTDNPVRQRNRLLIFAWFGLLIGLGFAFVIPVELRTYRKHSS